MQASQCHACYGLAKIGFFIEYSYLCHNVKAYTMRNSRLRLLIFAVIAAVFSLSGCANLKQIRVTSFSLDSVKPQGLRSIVVYASVGVSNPARQITLSDIRVDINHSGKVLGRVDADPLIIEAKSEGDYRLSAVVTLDESVSVFDILKLVENKRLEGCTVDVKAKAKIKGGASKKLEFNDVPLAKLIELI